MKSLVRWAAGNPAIALLVAALIVMSGILAYRQLPIDAVPDVTNIQVQVVTRADALSAPEVEAQITQPIERAMAGVPGLVQTRSVSRLGISLITLVFSDEVDLYFARTQVNERLGLLRDTIPPDVGQPELGPISTGLGEIYMFELTSSTSRSPEELRTIIEWQIGPRLRQVPGVVEVIGFGGTLKQYHVTMDPKRLSAYQVSVEEVRAALERDNAVSGGGYADWHGEQLVFRADGRFRSLEDIQETVIRTIDGIPVRVGDLGMVDTGPAIRYGAMSRDGRGEIVGGSVLMLKGQNSREVVARVQAAITAMTPTLPAGTRIVPYYDRAEFIDRVLATVAKNLGEGALITIACLLLTLGSLRAGLLVAGAIPFSMLVGFIGLRAIGYSGNVMSLGAIDFGIIVEGAVLSVEHSLSHGGSSNDPATRRHALVHAMEQVTRPATFGVVITLLVFLPLATLEDVEGRMFKPVVYSLCFMLGGALAYAFIVLPAIGPAVLAKEAHGKDPWLSRNAKKLYAPLLDSVLARPYVTLAASVAVLVGMLVLGGRIGADFLPRVFEGTVAIDAQRVPTISLDKALLMAHESELALVKTPEVTGVVSRIGRPENSIDPAGPEAADIFVLLKERSEWRKGLTVEKLVEELAANVDAVTPATVNAFSQPIEMRVNDLVAGAKGDVVVKVFGDDLTAMSETADRIRRVIQQIDGAADVKMEMPFGLPSVNVTADRGRAARLGISTRSILDAVAMTRAGERVGVVREGERVFDLVLRLGGDNVTDSKAVERLPIASQDGLLVPLSTVADVTEERDIHQIGRDQMRRRILVQANVRGRDVVSFVKDAQQAVAKVQLEAGTEVVWGGQFENFLRARDQLLILVPIAICGIAIMLFITFRRLKYVVVTLLNLPFALAGGLFSLWARGLSFSIPAGVGFIALCGVSVITGIVMTTNLVELPEDLEPRERVKQAALASLRARISTALVAAVGFVPAATATGTGAEVQRPLATVVIGGLIASLVLSLPALPAMLYVATRRDGRKASAGAAADTSDTASPLAAE
ncbi:MAG: hypothetical protein BGO98_15195 [Myxococcales bacterium 68-20]|nr:MAG: hypothetical protein BGO98_15195 [Myxococcales bacterium 68-20]